MTVRVDIDGTIFTEEREHSRCLARPIPGAIERLRALKQEGHRIEIESARGWEQLEMTEDQLQKHGVPYDRLTLGMRPADLIVNDRSVKSLAELDEDERLIRLHRQGTVDFLRRVAAMDLMEPIIEIGPMSTISTCNKVFERHGDTYVDSRELFAGRDYRSVDIDPTGNPDYVMDFAELDWKLPVKAGTIIALNILEHTPAFVDAKRIFSQVLKPHGLLAVVVPWNCRLHGPRPDLVRLSDDWFTTTFTAPVWQIDSLEKIACPGRPLHPVGFSVIVRKK